MKVILPSSAKIDGSGELVMPGTALELPHEEAALLEKIGVARQVKAAPAQDATRRRERSLDDDTAGA
jgi:hypothetical protein